MFAARASATSGTEAVKREGRESDGVDHEVLFAALGDHGIPKYIIPANKP